MNSTPQREKAIRWLLDGDPAIRWQTLRDLVGATQRSVERERSKVAHKQQSEGEEVVKGSWQRQLSRDAYVY